MGDQSVTGELFALAQRDIATVRSDGTALAGNLDGVVVHTPPIQIDHRGSLVEMFTIPDFWAEDFAYAYQSSIRPGMLKGWFAHEHKTDRYHLVSGELLLLLHDDRPESPTRGSTQKLLLSERSVRQVLIPPGVWHLSVNVGTDEAILINLPTELYRHDNPDRVHLPFTTEHIPVDVRSFFPVTFVGAHDAAATFC